MKAYYLIEEEVCGVGSIRGLGTSYKMRHLAELVDDHQYCIELSPRAW